MVIHVVAPGQTLWKISAYYGVSITSIVEINQLPNPDQLLIGQSLIIPTQLNPDISKPVINVNAYIYAQGSESVPLVMEYGDYLTLISPFVYTINKDGTLNPIDDTPIIEAAYRKKTIPMMTINNFSVGLLGEDVAHTVLSNPIISERLITNILYILKQKNYKGVSIDLENVLPQDRELYNQFLQRTVDRLHPHGFFVSTAVAPKTSSEQKGLLYEAHDYEAQGKIVDFILLMTYEWGYRFGPPQAISPVNQIVKVLNYAVTVIPREKIYFGFELYARDWTLPYVQGVEAETFSPQEAIVRATKYGAVIQYDYVAQSPFYRYRDEQGILHEVWFEDARSAQAKFDLVKGYGLAGIGYWVLGYPFPQNWVLLKENFIVRKCL